MFLLHWLDRNIEKTIMLISYIIMAGIIFVEVIRRFVFNQQAPWSSTIPIYLFLWIVWVGCAYNVKIRAHLSFDEVRVRLSLPAQYACLLLDSVLWLVFSLVVIYFSVEQVQLSRDNFSIVPGTDHVMQWWFYLATPFAFIVLIWRVLQNIRRDWIAFKAGTAFQIRVSVFGD